MFFPPYENRTISHAQFAKMKKTNTMYMCEKTYKSWGKWKNFQQTFSKTLNIIFSLEHMNQ